MKFNSDPSKPAQELYFSRKAGRQNSLDLTFHKSDVASSCSKKHLGLPLNQCLNKQNTSKMDKYYKIISIINFFSSDTPHDALLQIYKSFVRPIMDFVT